MNDSYAEFENEAVRWYQTYLDSFHIKTDEFEREYFIEKWHEHIPWKADPREIAGDCNNAILSFRQFHAKFEMLLRKTSRFITYQYFHWENGKNVSGIVESVEHYQERLLKKGIRR